MAVADPTTRPAAVAPPPTPGTLLYPPRITANRRQIDDRFPSLGFSVDTGGRPFFEVLLAADPSLFDPANAAKRTVANFYSSRQAGGLLPAAQALHPFLVPSAVLRAFASGAPRPRSLSFTVIAYADNGGADPAFAMPPASLAANAPSVAIASDFTGNTLATVLSVAVDKLQPYSGNTGQATGPSQQEDAGEGEDGYGATPPPPVAATAPNLAPTAPPAPAPALTPAQVPQAPAAAPAAHGQAFTPEGDYELAVLATAPAPAPSRSNKVVAPDPTLPGQSDPRDRNQGRAGATATSVSQGADYGSEGEEPGYLADDDDSESYGSGSTSQSFAAAEHNRQLDDHPRAFQSLDAAAHAEGARPLTIDDKMRIIDNIAPFESGGDYGAINADGEFEGRFGTNHPAYQHYHVGLSYGLIQFTQDGGKLGELLRSMHDRDAAAFDQAFGPNSGELLAVTNASGPSSKHSPGGRSARVQPVAGADLWVEPWVSRFRAAAQNERFKAAQREVAARAYLEPMLEFAGQLGLDTERALTLVVDRAIQMGPGGAKRWIVSAAGTVTSDAQRQQALAALGYPDLKGFQAATHGLVPDGEWGPNTHAALVAALRRLGPASPIPVPTAEQMVEAMGRRAATEPWHARFEALQRANLPDARYQL